jgi:large subunit ribosomal protein L15
VNLELLEDFPADTEITPETLVESGIIRDLDKPVKVLGRGDVSVALIIKVHNISKGAKDKVESAGGSVELIQE